MPDDPDLRKHEKRRVARKKSEPERKKKREKRKKELPVIEEEIAVTPDQLPAGYTLEDFRVVGDDEIIERYEHVREHLVLQRFHLQTLASKDGDVIVKARAPSAVVAGGHYGPGLYAHVITARCNAAMTRFRCIASKEWSSVLGALLHAVRSVRYFTVVPSC